MNLQFYHGFTKIFLFLWTTFISRLQELETLEHSKGFFEDHVLEACKWGLDTKNGIVCLWHAQTANMHHAPGIDIPPDCHFACRMLIYDMVLPVKQYLFCSTCTTTLQWIIFFHTLWMGISNKLLYEKSYQCWNHFNINTNPSKSFWITRYQVWCMIC